jgi:alpha-N-arabinofuranosidase
MSWVFLGLCVPASSAASRLVINADLGKHTIHRNIYGHFSEHLGRCIYEGYWVGEDSPIPHTRGIRNDVVEALKRIRVPVLRWPGGCFADEYHWVDGIGPREKRPSIVNVHWGGVTENNHFGTHEFLDLCALLGAEPYVCGNLGSGTVREMRDWVEYLTMDGQSPMADLRRQNGQEAPWKVPFFGVGNENWGCGGDMTPEYYANEYRRYAVYVRNFGGNRVFKIACGANGFDYRWTEVLMREAGRHMDGLSLHYYCGTGRRSRSATNYEEADWFHLLRSALRMEELVRRHAAIMDQYDPPKRVGLMVDEWGTWHEVEPGTNPGFLYQQNTLRDALAAALTLNIFNNHADRVRMANIAQTVNVLQAMILTRQEKMLLTPTYHVYEMYVPHHDAILLPTDLQSADYAFGGEKIPALNVSASRDQAGRLHVTLCNLDAQQPAELEAEIRGGKVSRIAGRVLTAPAITAHNTFEQPENVKPAGLEGARITGAGFAVTLPPRSVVALELE